MDIPEPEILAARQSFPDTQINMAGVPALFGSDFYTLGWKANDLTAVRGSFCIVKEDGPLANLVGDHLQFRYGASKTVRAYCVGSGSMETDIAVTRRVFAALELLAVDRISVLVEVVS